MNQATVEQVVDSSIRVLPGAEGWWAVSGSQIARLPREAVPDVTSRRLTEVAMSALAEKGFPRVVEDSNYAVTVLTATACNLGCAYCFQNTALPQEGSSAPPRIKTAVLTPALVTQVGAFVRQQMTSSRLETSSVLIFGGEPLLNPRGALGVLHEFGQNNMRMSEIVTNGVLLKKQLSRELEDAGLHRVQITFDGRRDVHDTIRVTRNGRPTYDKILSNVADAVASTDLTWNFRVNVSHRNLDGLETVIDDLQQALCGKTASFHLALIDDVGLGYDNDVVYSAENAERFIELNSRAIGAGMTVPVSKPLTDCPYCGVKGGAQGAVVNADGLLYSSWETAGRAEWAVGTLSDGYRPTEELDDLWVACDFDIAEHGTTEETRGFFDRVDGAALDDMYLTEDPASAPMHVTTQGRS
ncbi:radical SAM protein [Frigoribacterium sp. CFBP 8751]|uniref:radical SAM protein n=1 Tax=Frigoribacterium sp. CFBP 8751 TaxID=2775277 RepID=UPI00178248DA|nr:radical SAM protein [Frigoribacterium sp. CFBP 8751]MBD8537515.1 radical SAM protein [Frigoribacterium sp. CFBP 8751]